MSEKFTPGPWEADCDCFPIMVRAEKMDPDCHQDWVCNVGGDRANARLIAAAPDMYEALKEIDFLFACDDEGLAQPTHEQWLASANKISAALAKAEGAE